MPNTRRPDLNRSMAASLNLLPGLDVPSPPVYLGRLGLSLMGEQKPIFSLSELATSPLLLPPNPLSILNFLVRLSYYSSEIRDIWGLEISSDIVHLPRSASGHRLRFAPYDGPYSTCQGEFWVISHPTQKMVTMEFDDFMASSITFDRKTKPPELLEFLGDFFEEISVIKDIGILLSPTEL